MEHQPSEIDYEYQDEDPPPPHVVKAMSRIAIYVATYGDQSYMYLHDPIMRKPIAVVQHWLKEWGYTFGDEDA